MTYDHHCGTRIAEYSTYLTIEDTTHRRTWLCLDVDTFLIKCDMTFHVIHMIRTKTVHNLITAADRHGQTTTVALEIATETLVL